MIKFLNAMEIREDDETFQNPADQMFEALERKKPNHFAVRQYKKYKLAAGKTAKSIPISCGARLAPFDIQEVRDITIYNELALDAARVAPQRCPILHTGKATIVYRITGRDTTCRRKVWKS